MQRSTIRLLLAGLAVAAAGMSASAQYYPPGVGGWGGWGATTVGGDTARGAGAFAAGAGYYNESTAQARSINADTTMRVNEYMWESQQVANQKYYQTMSRRQKLVNETAKSTYDRLRNHPEDRDIRNGDALNVLFDELTDPKLYREAIQIAAKMPIPSQLVKNVKLRYASHGISISLNELNRRGVPSWLRTNPDIDAERKAAREAIEKAKASADETGEMDPDAVQKVQDAVTALQAKVKDVMAKNDPARGEVDNFLKALLGLTKMLQQGDIGPYLKELDTVSTTSLGHLISFMHTFNLRFGAASKPDSIQPGAAYSELYPVLMDLRAKVKAQGTDPLAVTLDESDVKKAPAFFSGLPEKAVTPPRPPAPGTR